MTIKPFSNAGFNTGTFFKKSAEPLAFQKKRQTDNMFEIWKFNQKKEIKGLSDDSLQNQILGACQKFPASFTIDVINSLSWADDSTIKEAIDLARKWKTAKEISLFLNWKKEKAPKKVIKKTRSKINEIYNCKQGSGSSESWWIWADFVNRETAENINYTTSIERSILFNETEIRFVDKPSHLWLKEDFSQELLNSEISDSDNESQLEFEFNQLVNESESIHKINEPEKIRYIVDESVIVRDKCWIAKWIQDSIEIINSATRSKEDMIYTFDPFWRDNTYFMLSLIQQSCLKNPDADQKNISQSKQEDQNILLIKCSSDTVEIWGEDKNVNLIMPESQTCEADIHANDSCVASWEWEIWNLTVAQKFLQWYIEFIQEEKNKGWIKKDSLPKKRRSKKDTDISQIITDIKKGKPKIQDKWKKHNGHLTETKNNMPAETDIIKNAIEVRTDSVQDFDTDEIIIVKNVQASINAALAFINAKQEWKEEILRSTHPKKEENVVAEKRVQNIEEQIYVNNISQPDRLLRDIFEFKKWSNMTLDEFIDRQDLNEKNVKLLLKYFWRESYYNKKLFDFFSLRQITEKLDESIIKKQKNKNRHITWNKNLSFDDIVLKIFDYKICKIGKSWYMDFWKWFIFWEWFIKVKYSPIDFEIAKLIDIDVSRWNFKKIDHIKVSPVWWLRLFMDGKSVWKTSIKNAKVSDDKIIFQKITFNTLSNWIIAFDVHVVDWYFDNIEICDKNWNTI
ncbi:MAG: hypothetical protein ACD_4C00441G0003 [uncultured bacterium (gcode 4)]|uniref:Uncharacterized protein n=1 Tax=uncultured bacterium (gcode 4) TaxID=1234023 RepID=K2GS02_9BACT|nr:MAG: hypothetical protein ACD_4C00441G0003 [uncultured bacterium (gcode 4)]